MISIIQLITQIKSLCVKLNMIGMILNLHEAHLGLILSLLAQPFQRNLPRAPIYKVTKKQIVI